MNVGNGGANNDDSHGLLETILPIKQNSDDKKLLLTLANCIYDAIVYFNVYGINFCVKPFFSQI